MTHAEVVIARRAVEEGRGLVVIVNKIDLLQGKENSKLLDKVMEAVPLEIQTVIPQVCFCNLLHVLVLFFSDLPIIESGKCGFVNAVLVVCKTCLF